MKEGGEEDRGEGEEGEKGGGEEERGEGEEGEMEGGEGEEGGRRGGQRRKRVEIRWSGGFCAQLERE